MWLVFLGAIVAIELARRLPLVAAFRRLAQTSAQAGRIVATTGSDRWKERAMRGISARLLMDSLRAGAMLLGVAGPLIVAVSAIFVLRMPAAEQVLTWSGR